MTKKAHGPVGFLRSAALILSMATAIPLTAQVGEARHDFAVGFNGGMAMNTVSFDPTIRQSMHSGPTFGLTMRYTCEKYFTMVCAIQVEVNYAKLGWKENITDYNDQPLPDRYQRHHHYIQVPVLARLGWGREERGMMGYLVAGPQIGYCFSETTEQSEEWTLTSTGVPNRPNNMYAQYSMPLERKLDYGITAGIGGELNTKAGHFMLEGRYYYGLSDLFGNSKKDTFARSANGAIVAKLTYLFSIKK